MEKGKYLVIILIVNMSNQEMVILGVELAAAALVVGCIILLYVRKPKTIDAARMRYNHIKHAIAMCNNQKSLVRIQCSVDEFFDHFYEKSDKAILKSLYEDLLRDVRKKSQAFHDENSYA